MLSLRIKCVHHRSNLAPEWSPFYQSLRRCTRGLFSRSSNGRVLKTFQELLIGHNAQVISKHNSSSARFLGTSTVDFGYLVLQNWLNATYRRCFSVRWRQRRRQVPSTVGHSADIGIYGVGLTLDASIRNVFLPHPSLPHPSLPHMFLPSLFLLHLSFPHPNLRLPPPPPRHSLNAWTTWFKVVPLIAMPLTKAISANMCKNCWKLGSMTGKGLCFIAPLLLFFILKRL